MISLYLISPRVSYFSSPQRRSIRISENPQWAEVRSRLAEDAALTAVASEDDRRAAFEAVVAELRYSALVRARYLDVVLYISLLMSMLAAVLVGNNIMDGWVMHCCQEYHEPCDSWGEQVNAFYPKDAHIESTSL